MPTLTYYVGSSLDGFIRILRGGTTVARYTRTA